MVTKPNTDMPVSGEEPLKKLPKVEPAKAVSGFAFPGGSPAKLTDAEPKTFKLPDKVTASEVQADSFRYGGSRKAGGETSPTAPDRKGRRS